MSPRLVEALCGVRIVAVSAGWNHSLAVTEEVGHLFSFGDGRCGQLGRGDDKAPQPRAVTALQGARVLVVAAGIEYSRCVLEDGRVYGWGHGQDEHCLVQLQGEQDTPLNTYPLLRMAV